jgi:hypothetical protein
VFLRWKQRKVTSLTGRRWVVERDGPDSFNVLVFRPNYTRRTLADVLSGQQLEMLHDNLGDALVDQNTNYGPFSHGSDVEQMSVSLGVLYRLAEVAEACVHLIQNGWHHDVVLFLSVRNGVQRAGWCCNTCDERDQKNEG